MKKYLQYKDSGVDWLGEIPSEWNTIKIKFTDTLIMGQSPESKDVTDFEKGFPFLQGNAEFTETHPIPKNWCEKPNKIAVKDDLLLSVRAPVGALNVSDQTYGIGRGLCAIRAKKNNLRFLYYLLSISKEELNKVSTGTTFVAITIPNLSNVVIPKANLPEQHAIVRFLDYKTGQIDRFITNRQKQIELLKEQKAGIINKAVTKGINPNIKMKDSRIEWIGEVPEHWDFKSLRRITKEHRQGYYIDEPYVTEGVKLVRITDLHSDGSIDYSEMPFVNISKEHEKLYCIKEGDFLFPRTGTIGSLGFVSNPERAVFASYLIRFRFKSNEVLTDYLYYYFMSDAFLDGVFSDLHGGVVQNIHAENIKNQFIAHPKELTEQENIIKYIKSETATIDNLISKYQKQIDLMQEYRMALISQAVTGKIDVREWKPKIKETIS